jgi:hypothetical protein
VKIVFSNAGNETKIVESFETETTHFTEQQQQGWQTILNHSKQYAESKSPHVQSS